MAKGREKPGCSLLWTVVPGLPSASLWRIGELRLGSRGSLVSSRDPASQPPEGCAKRQEGSTTTARDRISYIVLFIGASGDTRWMQSGLNRVVRAEQWLAVQWPTASCKGLLNIQILGERLFRLHIYIFLTAQTGCLPKLFILYYLPPKLLCSKKLSTQLHIQSLLKWGLSSTGFPTRARAQA